MSGSPSRDRATARVWSTLPGGTREALLDLGPTDLQVLLADVTTARAGLTSVATVRRRWATDRFVRLADSDPRRLSALEARLWELVPADFAGVGLSPVSPFGTSAALAGIGQDRVVSTTRGSEVVSDSTATLAIEAATRRRAQGRTGQVHVATVHTQLRTQPMGRASAHFRLLTLVSSARDGGSGGTHAGLLTLHLRTWRDLLVSALPEVRSTIEVSAWNPVVAERVADSVRPALGDHDRVALVDAPERTRAKGYYTDVALRLEVAGPDGPVEVGDGGLTRWTAALTDDRKELCLVSCVSTERLLALGAR
ncbi:MAG TPA: hypothetical protein VFT68_19195 [Lapillicoccus sp.]|nr:hypothetical protein [Lapillicoccus sp.]